MEAIILSSRQYESILNELDSIKKSMSKITKTKHEDVYLDNSDLLRVLKISKRTAQTWRDEGIISFSQIGSKIYYKTSDIEEMMKKHYKKSFYK